ncbi:MAG: glycosyltransferase family 2 protein [Gemmatimonadota bacterium]|nr:glycosyltransferase family 2 protein [Gemmatimonadota bacterium]
MIVALALALPWLACLAFVRFGVRFPSSLPVAGEGERPIVRGEHERPDEPYWPLVTVVVPARNEAHNIRACLASLTASRYPNFEVVVVDDRSEDGTGEVARATAAGAAHRLTVVEGATLPEGWLGKPWACHQGARAARGEVLLFTDADTVHGPRLLERALTGLRQERADLLTLVGRQRMDTFWERLLQPHVFLGMLFRFPDFERTVANDRWRDAIANGQFIMMPREAYARVGGHEVVRDEVVEDLALAQHVKRAGMRLRVRGAEDALETRMYRSLRELIDGWSKNLVLGGQQSFPRWARPLVPPVALVLGALLWLVPPAVLLLAGTEVLTGRPLLLGGLEPTVSLTWAALAVSASVAQFGYFSLRMGAGARYGLLYPLGAVLTSYIFLRSWVRGRNVRWKGRAYRVPAAGDRR